MLEIQPGIYQHYKGATYRVLGTAKHSESGDVCVVYQALYGACGLWLRPVSMFIEQVEVDGQRQARFALVQAQESLFTPL